MSKQDGFDWSQFTVPPREDSHDDVGGYKDKPPAPEKRGFVGRVITGGKGKGRGRGGAAND